MFAAKQFRSMLLWLGCAACCICPLRLQGEERDSRFVAGLCRLQQFTLAEHYCRRELALQTNSPQRQAELTIELIRSLALHALSLPREEREPQWREAHRVAEEFPRSHPQHSREFLIRVQDALTLLAQGEIAREEAEAAGPNPAALAEAAESLRGAAKVLGTVYDAIEREIPARRRVSPDGQQLTAEELLRLQLNVKLHLARAQRLQALCYPEGSRDRKALLLATLGDLDSALARLEGDDEIAGRMRLLQLACYRELGQLTEAQRIWPLTQREELPAEIRRAALAEAARLLIAAKRPQEAFELFTNPKYTLLTAEQDPEIDLARLEAALALGQQAGAAEKTEERDRWQKLAAALAQAIETQHGRAIARRADQLVLHLLPQDTAGGNIDLLARIADNLYVKQQVSEAIAAYDKAAAAAHLGQNIPREFELRYKAALAEQQQKHFAAASSRFERLAIDLKDYPQAPSAHLVACWNKAQQAREEPAAKTAYVALLREHVARWPEAPSADQARLWLGQWHQALSEWEPAFTSFSAISSDSTEFLAALSAAAECARQQLAAHRAEGKPDPKAAEEFIRFFAGVARERSPKERYATPAARAAALVAAELLLEFTPQGHTTAENLLNDVLKASPDADDEAWQSAAVSLRIAAIAGQPGRRQDAAQLLESLANRPEELLKLLSRLADTSARSGENLRKDLATLELEVMERLQGETRTLSAEQAEEFAQLRAAALALAGRRAESLAAYAELAKSLPKNGAVQVAYAQLLAESSEPEQQQTALGLWRVIASKSPPQSERWYQAKYNIATLQFKSGDTAAAATLCKYLLETPPRPPKPWLESFEKLLKSAGK